MLHWRNSCILNEVKKYFDLLEQEGKLKINDINKRLEGFETEVEGVILGYIELLKKVM